MRDKTFFLFFQVGFYSCCSLVAHPVTAQSISSDGTLPTPTEVNPTATGVEITGGTSSGGNLFHSFKDFSIPTGSEAFFNNAPNVVNILNRVTGGNISSINGLIRASGSANLFLINPAGIIFGEGASLDIGGSFYGSTADSILFPDEVEFSATDTQTQPILTINAPIGLNFRDNPQPLTNQSTANGVGLQVDTGKNITLVGGNLNFVGGKLTAPGGRVELGGLSVAGQIGISSDGSLTFPDGRARADVTLSDSAAVNVAGGGGGFINVNANKLILSGQSELFAGIAENSGSSTAQAGDITINTIDSLNLIGNPRKPLPEGATFEELIEFLTIERDTAIGIRNNVGLSSVRRNDGSAKSTAIGNGGSIVITTGTFKLTDIAILDTSIFGQGDGGNIIINADTVSVDQGIFLTQVRGFDIDIVREKANGNAGDVLISAKNISFDRNGTILADVQKGATGNGGDIIIQASDAFTLTGNSFFLTQLGLDARGNAGNISINAGSLNFNNRDGLPHLQSDAQPGSRGNAGDITINVANNASFDDTLILSQVQQEAVGDGGDINITANKINLTNNSLVLADTKGNGDAGNISIKANNINLTNNSLVLADAKGSGDAGNISINANSLILDNQAAISATTTSRIGGNIALDISKNLIMRDNSLISAQATGEADGGNVKINSDFIIAFPNQNNDIIANAQQGNGGKITINAQSVFGIEESPLNPITNDINASSAQGAQFDGIVEITTPDIDPFQETAETPENVVEPDQIVAGVCDASSIAKNADNSLTINGRGSLPPEPTEPFTAENILINGQSLLPNAERQRRREAEERALQEQYPPILTSQGAIYPARGIVKNPDGTIILTAYPTDNAQRALNQSSNCGQL